MLDIKLNGSLRPEIVVVGDERTPVIVIDEPIVTPKELIQYACTRAEFKPDEKVAYPGVRAELPREYMETLLPDLVTLIYEIYKLPPSYTCDLVLAVFSLITRQPENLAPLQRIPHYDTHSRNYFATVHYLNPGNFAGTGIFRHRPTGYERLSKDRFQEYVRAAESHMKANGLPAAAYISSSDDHYELVAEIKYRPNRLVLYPGNLLHSPLVQAPRDINGDPATGRLTANLFMEFSARWSR